MGGMTHVIVNLAVCCQIANHTVKAGTANHTVKACTEVASWSGAS